jgi:hypothetical protein
VDRELPVTVTVPAPPLMTTVAIRAVTVYARGADEVAAGPGAAPVPLGVRTLLPHPFIASRTAHAASSTPYVLTVCEHLNTA